MPLKSAQALPGGPPCKWLQPFPHHLKSRLERSYESHEPKGLCSFPVMMTLSFGVILVQGWGDQQALLSGGTDLYLQPTHNWQVS